MDERILQIFQQHPNDYVSGEELSRLLNCSRTAIWKHIEALRKAGYEFEAVSRKGYKLTKEPDKLSPVSLLAGLQTQVMGRRLHMYKEVDSTQSVAHSLIAAGAGEGTLVLAELQTAGRGRMGRTWYSPAGKGIWMSLVLTPKVPVYFMPQLTLVTAVALCRAIRKTTGLGVGIKWPNDLLIGGKKLSGILLESSTEDERLKYVIAGIGITANVKLDDFPEELRPIATSLAIELGAEVRREALIQTFLLEFEELYQLYQEKGFGPIRLLWEALSVSLHKPIRTKTADGWLEGVAESLDDSGALTIVTAAGERVRVHSGEIEHR